MNDLDENMQSDNTKDKIIYFKSKIGFSTFFYLLFSGMGIFILSICLTHLLFDSISLILSLSSVITVFFLFYKSIKNVFIIELSNEGVQIKYPFSVLKNQVNLEYTNLTSAYFYCGPFGLNSPTIVIQYKLNNKVEKLGFACYTPSNIENILNSLSMHEVKTGISTDSVNYSGLKDKLKVIHTS